MHYRIVYGKKKQRLSQLTKRQKVFAIAFISCLSLAVFLFAGGAKLLLPGDPEFSSVALENMVQAIQNGETLADAVTAFCEEILANAQIQ